ncbi:MAG TPA: aldehyde dehydrogenase family protein, partial [Candidatus Sulfotelmatobacter sp.]|nr:aldehyde dehydrogenase family protein [Candidatus Sulfotelmatobacter sp.]
MQSFNNIVNAQAVVSAELFESRNPATDEVLGMVSQSSADEVNRAVAAARAAQPGWASRASEERKALTHRVADVLKQNSEYLAEWVTLEQGKPLGGVGPDQVPGSRFEVWACEAWTRVTADLDLAIEIAFEDKSRRDEVHRKPFGVIAAIAPWNWPLMI